MMMNKSLAWLTVLLARSAPVLSSRTSHVPSTKLNSSLRTLANPATSLCLPALRINLKSVCCKCLRSLKTICPHHFSPRRSASTTKIWRSCSHSFKWKPTVARSQLLRHSTWALKTCALVLSQQLFPFAQAAPRKPPPLKITFWMVLSNNNTFR